MTTMTCSCSDGELATVAVTIHTKMFSDCQAKNMLHTLLQSLSVQSSHLCLPLPNSVPILPNAPVALPTTRRIRPCATLDHVMSYLPGASRQIGRSTQ